MINNREIYFMLFLAVINPFIYFILLPYAQIRANSHMDAGPAFSLILLVISIIITITSIKRYLKTKEIRIFLFPFITIVNLVYWAYRLGTLECFGCSAG
ncbi:hypothetical protein NAT51_19130 [Flavobacterium amniphilum]|uniref:hypothetical protein n=1 Tax=Flavobacterium amniphilum TaxID=1834035 RepID=UPI00202A8B88|nr:hypothetical protein [Flavobacterium amniphilum]MCL9807644.1 hypothetical protein [Flavobacterium amniphilum]